MRPDSLRELLLFAPVAVYGGYFGAGMSVMLVEILSVSNTDDFRATNVIKDLIDHARYMPIEMATDHDHAVPRASSAERRTGPP